MLDPTLQILRDPARLAALRRTALLDSPAEESYDRLARLAARILNAPIALVNLVDDQRQFSKSCFAPTTWPWERNTPLADSFCRHAVASREPLLIEDTREHPLVGSSAVVTELGVISYAGVPLIESGGHALGALCVLDVTPRRWSEGQVETLRELAALVSTEIELRLEIDERRRSESKLREREELFRTVLDTSPIGVGLVALDGAWIRVNRALCEILGQTEGEMLGGSIHSAIHPEDRLADAHKFACLVRGEIGSYEAEQRWLRPDGAAAWVLSTRSLARDEEGHPLHFIVQAQDITDRRRGEEALRASERRFRSLIENASDMVTVLDMNWIISYESPSVERVLGHAPDELIGRSVLDLVHPDDVPTVMEKLGALRDEADGVQAAEIRLRHRDGSWRILEAKGSNRIQDAAIGGLVVNSRDITERKQAEEQLARYAAEIQEMSLRDELTGLLNRRGFSVLAEARLKLARRMGLHAVVLAADLDGLKPINDALGHATGDVALIEAARVIETTLRDADIVARLGGDEFAAVAIVNDPADIECLRTRLEEGVRARNREGERPYTLSISVGFAGSLPGAGDSWADLLERADAEMYAIKRRKKEPRPTVGAGPPDGRRRPAIG